jgi:phage terminase small subunit
MPNPATLTAKQTRFISEYLVDGNGAGAAARAGYSPKTARAIATENLTKPAIQNALQARQAADATRLSIQREDVLAGLQEAVQQAREQHNPMGMIAGYRELAKMLGFYAPEVKHVELTAGQAAVKGNFAAMSDEQLLALIAQGAAAE